MSGETDLAVILRSLDPVVRPGEFVFVTVDRVPTGLAPQATVAEDEGLTVVLLREEADDLGLDYDFIAGWITLRVHSSLAAVGLTAVFSAALGERGISCNVIAGRHHDHLLVPADLVEEALATLLALASASRDRDQPA